jgi:4-hydroxy-4-methyl-2-oxoglutarate aldolase
MTVILDAAQLEQAKTKLYSAVVCDVLDTLGYRNQGMRTFVRPLDDQHVVFGPARTGAYMKVGGHLEGENPYDIEMDLLDDLKEGEVVVFGVDGPTDNIVPWGELLTTGARARKAAGCVTDGLIRDARQIREVGFPVFHGGIGPWDSKGRGKMVSKDVAIQCGGVTVNKGDYVIADIDGVVVIPNKVVNEAIAMALAKVDSEDTVRAEILAGSTLRAVYDKHGVL